MSAIRARKTYYRGIQMRSRLEARFAGVLDSIGVEWDYEGPAFASGAVQYLPDFRGVDCCGDSGCDPRPWFIEVKPVTESIGENPLGVDFERMAVIFESEPRARIALACPAFGLLFPTMEQERGTYLSTFMFTADGSVLHLAGGRSSAPSAAISLANLAAWALSFVGWGATS